MRKIIPALAALFLWPLAAESQTIPSNANVVASCGTPNTTYTANTNKPVTMDTTGKVCTGASITPSGTQDVNQKNVNGATINVGPGASGTGTQRVTTSTDSTIGTVTTVTSATVIQPTAANLNATVVGTGTFAVQSAMSPAARTIIPLDASSVTTGGTAVTALTAGHRTAGGFLYNPIGATINLCINEQATASGTTSAGALTCIQPGQSYSLTPAAGAVSVITSDSTHPFSGQGLN